MSEEEQHMVMGRTVEEYAKVGRELTALSAKADGIKKELQRFASYLGTNEPYSSLAGCGKRAPKDQKRPKTTDALTWNQQVTDLGKSIQDQEKGFSATC
jgi:hypothetical protein